MVDGRHDRGKQDAEYWLKLVQAFGGNSPVLVVMNRQKMHAFDIDRSYLAGKYNVQLEHFFRTDCEDEKSIQPLCNTILQQVAQMLAREELFPAKYWNVKTRLAAMKTRGEDYLSDEDYVKICEENDVKDPAQQQTLLRRLADLGTVVSFPDDIKLSELTVLNPEWATDGIYRVVTNEPLREERHGQLKRGDLRNILPKERWPKAKHLNYLLDLMQKFELCFDLEEESNTVLVPELLRDETPLLSDWDAANCVVFLYKYLVLPHGVLPRFITRTHPLSRGRDRWRTGVVLGDDGAEALVKADYDANQVSIWVRGAHADARRALFKVVRHHFDAIHARIKDLNPQELVALPGFPNVTVSFRDLVLDERAGQTTTRVTINDTRREIPIADLLNGVESPAERKAAQQKARDGGIHVYVADGGSAQIAKEIMEAKNEQNISGGTFNAPVGINQTFTNCYNTIRAVKNEEKRIALEGLVKQVETIHPHLVDEKAKVKAERQVKLLTEEAAQPEPDKDQIQLSGKGLIEAAETCAKMAGPVITATKAVLGLFGVSLP